MGGESAEFLKRMIDEFHCVKGIMLSDNDGVLICQSAPQKENEKFMQTTALLISALNQTQSNLQKVQHEISRPKPIQTYAQSTFTTKTISYIWHTSKISWSPFFLTPTPTSNSQKRFQLISLLLLKS